MPWKIECDEKAENRKSTEQWQSLIDYRRYCVVRCGGWNIVKPVYFVSRFLIEISFLSLALILRLFFPVADYHSDTVRHNMHSERRMRRGSAEERMKLSVDANRSTGNLFTATRSQISSIDTGYWLRSHTGQFFDWEKNEWHSDTRPSWE